MLLKLVFFTLSIPILFTNLTAAMFHTIDTRSPLLCNFSYKFQNRVMLDRGKIQKVVASDEDRLSIFTDSFSGQIFISTREYAPQETTISIIAESGVVQDLQISFVDRSSEVVILSDPTLEQEEQPLIDQKLTYNDQALSIVEKVLKGEMPNGYIPCQTECKRWKPKKGIVLEAIVQLEGPNQILYLYQVTNTTNKSATLQECELQVPLCRWVFLESNALLSKQKMLGIIAVERLDE